MTHDLHLCLFLSRATPLSRWDSLGMLQRETAIYKKMLPSLADISIVTSGGEEEFIYQHQLQGFNILHNRWGLSPNFYSLLAPFLHWHTLRQATIYKTNQLDGAWAAIVAGILHRKPVVVRAGYLWGHNFEQEKGKSLKSWFIYQLESLVFKQATHIFLTTPQMKIFVSETYNIPPTSITVIPNYVDTEQFCPDPLLTAKKGRICFVGRLNAVKNLDLLIKSLALLPDTELVLIGQGEEESSLRQLAEVQQVDVLFRGLVPNSQLPTELNQSEIFVLPSRFEGHPKALLEAMACGMAVIGTDVFGIREVIKHGETGWLCKPTVENIHKSIEYLLVNPNLRTTLGKNARQYVLSYFALSGIAKLELEIFNQITLNSK